VEVSLPALDTVEKTGWTILKYEAYRIHAARLEALADLYGEPLYRDLMAGKSITYNDYCLAKQKAGELSMIIDQVLETVDYLASPTAYQLLPSIDDKQQSERFTKSSLRILYNVSGHPALATPLLRSREDLPVGVQWAAKKFSERGYFSDAFKLIHRLSPRVKSNEYPDAI